MGLEKHSWFSRENETLSIVCSLTKRSDLKILIGYKSAFVFACFCYAVSSLPFISFSSITGSFDQVLMMLFSCHGFRVLQYAPRYCVQSSSVFSLPSLSKDCCHFPNKNQTNKSKPPLRRRCVQKQWPSGSRAHVKVTQLADFWFRDLHANAQCCEATAMLKSTIQTVFVVRNFIHSHE